LGRKKAKHQEEENAERWLVSYADFMTLLFAFFTTLYAISTVDAQKMGRMVYSMRASFDSAIFEQGSRTLSLSKGSGGAESSSAIVQNYTMKGGPDLKEKTLKELEGLRRASKKPILSDEKAMGRLKRSVETLLGPEVIKGKVRAHMEPRGLVISLGENGLFDSGADQIKPEGKVLLDTLATSLVSLGNYIRVEGHTDNVPIHNSRFPSNWELSTARATAVISRLVGNFGIRPDLVSAAGYAEYRPCSQNDTEEGKARNRRVDVIILNPVAAGVEPK
jgi:chemotaxis protein MotB